VNGAVPALNGSRPARTHSAAARELRHPSGAPRHRTGYHYGTRPAIWRKSPRLYAAVTVGSEPPPRRVVVLSAERCPCRCRPPKVEVGAGPTSRAHRLSVSRGTRAPSRGGRRKNQANERQTPERMLTSRGDRAMRLNDRSDRIDLRQRYGIRPTHLQGCAPITAFERSGCHAWLRSHVLQRSTRMRSDALPPRVDVFRCALVRALRHSAGVSRAQLPTVYSRRKPARADLTWRATRLQRQAGNRIDGRMTFRLGRAAHGLGQQSQRSS
jgi:hypothetical protein